MPAHDVIVVGARCAGAATAMLLARAGARVLLVDRATFPSDIPHGHFVHRHGPERLARWGLLGRLLETGAPPVTHVVSDLGDRRLVGEDLEPDGIPFGIAPRRAVLDLVLVEAAVEAGAELRDGYAVLEYLLDGDRVVGIRGRDVRTGTVSEARAAWVVGADGRGSGLARAVAAEAPVSGPALTCWYWSYFSGMPSPGLEMVLRDGRILFAFPTNGDCTAVFVGWRLGELPRVKAGVEDAFLAATDAVPEVGERVRAARREERFYGATQLPNFLRRPHGDGWALVGDAGCHKDPFMALGICDALRDAELLAEALAAGLSGREDPRHALARYERRRDEATTPDWHMNFFAAHLQPPPPPVQARRTAAAAGPEAARRYFLEVAGRLPAAAAA